MRAAKIFVGILQLPIAILIVFQTYSAWSQIVTTDHIQKIIYAAFIIGVAYLIAGTVNLLTNDSKSFIPEIIYFVLLLIGWFFARNDAKNFNFLNFWAWLGFFLGLIFIAWHIAKITFLPEKKPASKTNARRTQQRHAVQPAPDHNSYNTAAYPQQTLGNVQQSRSSRTQAPAPLPSRSQMRAKKNKRGRK
ncbi:hypothetical protein ACFQ5M_03805 [Agrilactobacillus yilanensis]|uniref:Uncharacterized protein n=1 Tax=Agrilactobacillus yilanensis TaxID=2485997 RepID=A0ABW4J6J0_9LACO|nr:hypothetical protein [Agrilactobacillus yilanensis]